MNKLAVALSLASLFAPALARAQNAYITNNNDGTVSVINTTTNMVVGSPKTIADYMQEIFEAGGGDGFVLMPNLFPVMFEEFGRMVVPELQRRGLFRTEYAGRTMRENLRS